MLILFRMLYQKSKYQHRFTQYESKKTDVWDDIPLLKWSFILLQRILFNKLYLLNTYFLFRIDDPPPISLSPPHSNRCCCSNSSSSCGVRLVTSPSGLMYQEHTLNMKCWQIDNKEESTHYDRGINPSITFSTTIHTDYPGIEPRHPRWADQWFSYDTAYPVQICG